MPPAQQLLFPDPQPLVERLGREFFRHAPQSPGVYLMRDAADQVLYVGKAKNLRKRLGSYRVANPVGWFHGQLEEEAIIHCGLMIEPVASNLENLLSGHSGGFCEWIRSRLPAELHPFEEAWLEADLEFITDAFPRF